MVSSLTDATSRLFPTRSQMRVRSMPTTVSQVAHRRRRYQWHQSQVRPASVFAAFDLPPLSWALLCRSRDACYCRSGCRRFAGREVRALVCDHLPLLIGYSADQVQQCQHHGLTYHFLPSKLRQLLMSHNQLHICSYQRHRVYPADERLR